jgi:carboxyl-terminal processing protease
MPRRLGPALAILPTLCAALAQAAPAPSAAEPALSWQQTRLLAEVIARIRSEYVDPVDEQRLVEGAVRGMLGMLDASSSYLPPDEQRAMESLARGTRDGVGLDLAADPDGLRVLDPLPGSPAEKAGLRKGDLVVSVDGAPLAGIDPAVGSAMLRGSPGSTVTIEVERPGEGPRTLTLERARVAVSSVSAAPLAPGLIGLRISEFSASTAAEVARALADAARSAPLEGAILDLRGNGGGLLDAAVEVADQFLEPGPIVSARGRAADASFEREATTGDLLRGAPLVVLVDGATASAAEVLTGALQDRRRATVVGARTYGKGTVQTVLPLARGGALKFTTARYLTPAGRAIDGAGIEPDLAVAAAPSPAEPDPPLARALAALEAARAARADHP